MGWRDTIRDSKSSWRDTIREAKEPAAEIPEMESASKGFFDTASFGLDDEFAGGLEAIGRVAGVQGFGAPNFSDAKFAQPEGFSNFGANYEKARDARRLAKMNAEEANSKSYFGGQVAGGFVTPASRSQSALSAIGKAAAAGGVYGAGSANTIEELPESIGVGTLAGGAGGAIGEGAKKLINAKNMGKAARFFSGVDEEAATRQMQRPTQTRAAQAEDFVYNTGQKAMNDIDLAGNQLGENVEQAKRGLIQRRGSELLEAPDAMVDADRFLKANKPSSKGYSALSDSERTQLQKYSKDLAGSNVEDLVKFRDEVDHVERLAEKYGMSALSPYEKQLMKMRGQINEVLRDFDPQFKQANQEFSQFADDSAILGLNQERTAEQIVGNLYGANKTAKQKAAERVLSGGTLDNIKDIAANKSFSGAKGPAGSEFGMRRMLGVVGAVPTGGLSLLLISPDAWKHGLRGLGHVGQKLGKFGPVLEQAAQRGSLPATHHVLQQQNQEYREILRSLDQEEEGQ